MKISLWKVLFGIVLNTRGSLGEPDPAPVVEPVAEPSALGGDPEPVVEPTPDPEPNPEPLPPSIYGDKTVEWPEGTEDTLKNEPSLKPFVGDDGKVNTANLLKSYFHTKKMQGVDKAVLPTENSSDEEIQEFFNKLGASSDAEAYKITRAEDSSMGEAFVGNLQKFAHENKLPLPVAKKLSEFMETQAKSGMEETAKSRTATIAEGLQGVKDQMGAAYEHKIGLAKRVLSEVVGDPELIKAFNNPEVGSNPAVLKTMMMIGEKLFKEDGFKGGDNNQGMLSPEEAQDKINEILGDKNDPYHKSEHPSHAKAQKDMLKLFEMRNALKK